MLWKNTISWILIETCRCSVCISICVNCSLWVKYRNCVNVCRGPLIAAKLLFRTDVVEDTIYIANGEGPQLLKAAKELHRGLLSAWQAVWGAGNLLLICHGILAFGGADCSNSWIKSWSHLILDSSAFNKPSHLGFQKLKFVMFSRTKQKSVSFRNN